MPKYDYKCMTCSYAIEVAKPITQSDTIELCEKCGEAMVKQFGTFGIQFKGTGFYKTDNAK